MVKFVSNKLTCGGGGGGGALLPCVAWMIICRTTRYVFLGSRGMLFYHQRLEQDSLRNQNPWNRLQLCRTLPSYVVLAISFKSHHKQGNKLFFYLSNTGCHTSVSSYSHSFSLFYPSFKTIKYSWLSNQPRFPYLDSELWRFSKFVSSKKLQCEKT